jgi:hypothetical protein
LLALEEVPTDTRARLVQAEQALDPLALLEEIRRIQAHLGRIVALGAEGAGYPGEADIQTFLTGLSTLWKEGDLKPARSKRRRRIPREDWGAMGRPKQEGVEMVWGQIEAWLMVDPAIKATAILARLEEAYPALFSTSQIRTLQRRIKEWRSAYAKRLVFRNSGFTGEECG